MISRQVLACAPSNVAVDNMVEKLVKGKLKVSLKMFQFLTATTEGFIRYFLDIFSNNFRVPVPKKAFIA